MKDSYGDGWDGAYWSWCSDDGACSTGTLESGASGTTTLCTIGCETLAVGGGDYPSEVSWALSDGSSGEGGDKPHDMCAPSVPTEGGRYSFEKVFALHCHTHAHH